MTTYRPPADVARAAREGMKLRASLPPSKQCCTSVGVRRGVQLSNREPVSLDTIKRMYSYFRRHEVDSKGKGWGVDSKGWQAWLLWGGWEGYEWVAGILGKTMNPSPLDEYLDGFFARHPKLSRYRSRIRFSDKEKGASPGHGEARQYADEIWVFPKFWKLGDVGVQDFVMAHEIGHWVLSQHGLAEAIREAYSLDIDPWDTFNLPFGQFNMDEAFSDSFASYYTDGDVKSRYPKWTRLVEVVQQRANPAKVGPKRAEAIAEGFKYVALKGNKIVAYADTKAEAQSVGTPEKLPTIPARYLKGLNKKDKVKRVLEIFKERESPTYKPLPSDKGVKTERSGWAGKFERKYGRPGKNVADVAKLTGIKKSILDEVYRKGLAAWSTGGHRPGASQHAWALARVYSFVLGGPTATGPDRYLAVRAGLLKNPIETLPEDAYEACDVVVKLLQQRGFEIRKPSSDSISDKLKLTSRSSRPWGKSCYIKVSYTMPGYSPSGLHTLNDEIRVSDHGTGPGRWRDYVLMILGGAPIQKVKDEIDAVARAWEASYPKRVNRYIEFLESQAARRGRPGKWQETQTKWKSRTEPIRAEIKSLRTMLSKNPASPDDPPGIAYVKDLAYKLETERGLNPGAAMGVAWSIACKYKRDDIPELDDHCKRPPEDYL